VKLVVLALLVAAGVGIGVYFVVKERGARGDSAAPSRAASAHPVPPPGREVPAAFTASDIGQAPEDTAEALDDERASGETAAVLDDESAPKDTAAAPDDDPTPARTANERQRELTAAVRAQARALQRCLSRTQERGVNVARNVRVNLVIEASGRVGSATTTPREPALADCVSETTAALQISPAEDGRPVTVSFDVNTSVASSPSPPAPPPATGAVPDSPTRADVTAGVTSVRAQISRCGDASPAKGKVRMKVRVGSDGRVESATVDAAPDAALGRCVANALLTARFPESRNGITFSYPFVF
jgi:hypothetical protein